MYQKKVSGKKPKIFYLHMILEIDKKVLKIPNIST